MIAYYKEILADESVCMKVVKDELLEIKEKYGDERKTEIIYSSEEFNAEDFYADDEMIITISHMGYIKRTPLSEFRAQNRGGVGAKEAILVKKISSSISIRHQCTIICCSLPKRVNAIG